MNYAVLGTGDVGRMLATGLIKMGHEVMIGSRRADNAMAVEWVEKNGSSAHTGTFEQATKFGEVIFIATLGSATQQAITLAGPGHFANKTVIDVTNPLDFSKGMPPQLSVGHTDSLGEQVQRWLPMAYVVKALNIVNNKSMVNPSYPGGNPVMFICGNNEPSKKQVNQLLQDMGWKDIIDIGGIEGSRYLEPLCLLWVLVGLKSGTWNHAFALVRN